ncbi:NAD-dependent epimerase/dehydratase family protein [Neobacillus sp. Marseille-QA0830]
MTKILIIGGTGTISSHTVDELLSRKHEVAIFNRRKTNLQPKHGIKNYIGDRNNEQSLKEVMDEFTPEVIIDYFCFTKEQAKQMIELSHSKVKHFIFVSTVDTYGYPLKKLPASEEEPNNPAVSEYAKQKQECEELFLSYHDEEKFPVTIVRPLYSLGPHFLLSIFSRNAASMINRIKADQPVIVPGDGTTLMQPSDARDTGRMIAYLAGEKRSYGKIYNCGSPNVMNQDEYVQLIAKALGKKANIVHIPAETLLGLTDVDIQSSLFFELTRFQLVYSLETFSSDFPEFQWETNIHSGIAGYIENVENGDIVSEDDMEEEIFIQLAAVN